MQVIGGRGAAEFGTIGWLLWLWTSLTHSDDGGGMVRALLVRGIDDVGGVVSMVPFDMTDDNDSRHFDPYAWFAL